MRKLIIGVDPGVTCGVAALNLEGEPIYIGSRRNWRFSDLLQTIIGLGEPVVISTDVSSPPDLLKRLSQKFNAVSFIPQISLGIIEKRQMARKYAEFYGVNLRNVHEMDALAAAIKAYQHYRDKLEQVEDKVREMNVKVELDDVKALVIRGYSIKRAIERLLSSEKPKITPLIIRRVPSEERLREVIRELRERLVLERERFERLKEENVKLKHEIESLKRQIENLQHRIADMKDEQILQIRREREYQNLLDEIRTLKDKLSEAYEQLESYKERLNMLHRVRELESKGEMILLKPIETFTREGIDKALKLYEIKPKDSVILLDGSGGGRSTAEILARKGVRAVITCTRMAHQAVETFKRYGIPIIPSSMIKIIWVEGFPYIESAELEKAITALERREAEQAFKSIEKIIEEHRRNIIKEKLQHYEN